MQPPLAAVEAPLRTKPSNYPPEFARRMEGREKRPLGDLFNLSNFGVNLTTLPPGAVSALHHGHSQQDEFIYILSGRPTLHLGETQFRLAPGMCAGFPKNGEAHHLHNDTDEPVTLLEIGDRSAGDEVFYPRDDLKAVLVEGKWQFTRKDGAAY